MATEVILQLALNDVYGAPLAEKVDIVLRHQVLSEVVKVSPNAAKQINIKFPLLSDMNKKMLREYGILKGYDVQNETYQWAQRANIVIDKSDGNKHIDFRCDDSSIPVGDENLIMRAAKTFFALMRNDRTHQRRLADDT